MLGGSGETNEPEKSAVYDTETLAYMSFRTGNYICLAFPHRKHHKEK